MNETLFEFRTRSQQESEQAIAGLAERLQAGSIVCLSGALGSGKSVCARALARNLGVSDPMPSPTFVLVHEYRGHLPVLHVDLYRLESQTEFDDLAIDETMSGAVTLVEWPERAPRLLAEADYVVTIATTGTPDERTISVVRRQGDGA